MKKDKIKIDAINGVEVKATGLFSFRTDSRSLSVTVDKDPALDAILVLDNEVEIVGKFGKVAGVVKSITQFDKDTNVSIAIEQFYLN